MSRAAIVRPWYREPWPWLLMLPPFGAVLGGVAMLALAVGSPEALVVDDYARIEDLTRAQFAADRRAEELGLRAAVTLAPAENGGTRITVDVSADGAFTAPLELGLKLRHAARAEADRTVLLSRDEGTYVGETSLAGGRYTLELAAQDASWRLTGRVAAVPATLELTPERAGGQ